MNANKQDAGGLLPDELEAAIQDVADHANSDGDFVSNETERATENLRMKIRAYGELCRAAPAGGDDWPFLEEIGRDGKPTGYWVRKGSPAAARMSAPAGGEPVVFVEMVEDEWRLSVLKSAPRDSQTIMRHGAHLYLQPKDSAPAGSGDVLSVYSLNRVIDRVEGEAQWNDWSQGRILTELRNYIRAQATVIPDPQSMGDDEVDNIESYATALERMSLCNSRTADGANLAQAARFIHEYAALLRKLQQGAE